MAAEPAWEPGEDEVSRVVTGGTRRQGQDRYRLVVVVAGSTRGRIPRRRRRREPQQEPRLVDAEQLGVPERSAAGGGVRPGAELRASVPRRPDRHHRQQRLNTCTCMNPEFQINLASTLQFALFSSLDVASYMYMTAIYTEHLWLQTGVCM